MNWLFASQIQVAYSAFSSLLFSSPYILPLQCYPHLCYALLYSPPCVSLPLLSSLLSGHIGCVHHHTLHKPNRACSQAGHMSALSIMCDSHGVDILYAETHIDIHWGADGVQWWYDATTREGRDKEAKQHAVSRGWEQRGRKRPFTLELSFLFYYLVFLKNSPFKREGNKHIVMWLGNSVWERGRERERNRSDAMCNSMELERDGIAVEWGES